jgi:hypothetical protein
MKTEKEDFIKYATHHTIADFANFSIKDVIALQFLARYQNPIVRHLLYTEVKQFIEFKENSSLIEDLSRAPEYKKKFFSFIEEKKKLYPPSFYNMLSNLREIGLLRYQKSNSGKIPNIEDTPYTNYIPLLLLKFLINNNIMVSEEYREEFSTKFLDVIRNQKFNRILTIWFSEYIMMPITTLLSEYSKEQYILHKNISKDIFSDAKEVKHVKTTEMIGKKISMAEEMFDGIIIPVYKKDPKFHDMDRIEILKEIVRVTQPKGLIIIVSIAKVPESQNVFLNELITLYNLSLNNRIFSKGKLRSDLEEVNLKNIEVIEHQGLLIGIGNKSE